MRLHVVIFMQVQTAANSTSSKPPATASAGQLQPPPTVAPSMLQAAAAPNTPPTAVDMQAKLKELGVEADSKPKTKQKSKLSKQIPTVFGLLILFAALVSGVFLFGQGTGVFAPRATPETTPKNIIVSNVTDKSFTVSFFTDESTIGYIKYGEQPNKFDKQASDDRDQLSGIVKDYRLHQVTVRGLQPGTTYYYTLGTGTGTFDNQGEPYQIQTAARPSQSPPNNQTVYGNVFLSEQVPADGAIVFVESEGMGTLSTLVKASGSFGLSLANAFNLAKTDYVLVSDDTLLTIRVQAPDPQASTRMELSLADAQPVADILLSADQSLAVVDKDELLAPAASDLGDDEQASAPAMLDAEEEASPSATADMDASALAGLLEEEVVVAPPTEEEIIHLGQVGESVEPVTIETTQPLIKQEGLPANITIRITVHSDTQIDQTLTTDANGGFSLDVAALGQNLEPGEHTATYSYTDPITGEEVTKTYTFVVAGNAAPRQLAQAATTPVPTAAPTVAPTAAIPYGSGNPYVPPTASPTADLELAVTATPSTHTAIVATTSGTYNAGSVSETFLLLAGGLFFIFAGVWSYALAAGFRADGDYY